MSSDWSNGEARRKGGQRSAGVCQAFAQAMLRQQRGPAKLRSQALAPFLQLTLLARGDDFQPVPLLVDDALEARLKRVTERIGELIVTLPRRVAEADPALAAHWWGLAHGAAARNVLAQDDTYAREIYRLDIVESGEALMVIEANMGPSCSGFYGTDLLPLYLEVPQTASFLRAHQLKLRVDDPMDALASHVLTLALQVNAGANTARVGFAVPPPLVASVGEYMQARLGAHGSRLGVQVGVRAGSEVDIAVGEGEVTLGGEPVDVLLRSTNTPLSRELFAAELAGHVINFDTPTSYFSGDKRNFARLTSVRPEGLFNPQERALLDAHVPWTAVLDDTPVAYRSDKAQAIDIARRHRERMVLKHAFGNGGTGVSVGLHTAPAQWEQRLTDALGEGQFIIQEYHPPNCYVLHDKAAGFCEHEVVFGTFRIGDILVNGTARMKPTHASDGVVNVSTHGTESVVAVPIGADGAEMGA